MHPQYLRRQNSDITAIPSADGIDGSRTAHDDPSATKLVVGSGTGGLSSTDGPDFAVGNPTLILTSTSTTDSPSQSPSGNIGQSAAKSGISLSTVIGVCLGAFVGAGLLICISIWFYRRSLPPPPRARQKPPNAQSRDTKPTSSWTKFDDDQWEGRNGVSEKGTGSDFAHGTQRMSSPQSTRRSLVSDDHFGSQHDVTSRSVPFAQYHPKLEPPRPIDDRVGASLDGSTTGSYLSLGTVHIESGKMSPTFTAAKMTPPATSSTLHRWESAEVIDPDSQAQEVEVHHDPFSETSTPTTYSPTETFGDRRSFRNPFFNAHPGIPSRHASTVRKSSTMSISSDPFNNNEIIAMPKPRFISHGAQESSSSGGSLGNEKSMKSLIAALELPQEVVEERLRIASMQPSEISRYSTGTEIEGYAMPVPETAEQGYVQ